MGKKDDHTEIFKLLGDFCTVAQLKNLVKAFRPNVKDFPISVSAEELLKLVKELYLGFHVPPETVENLLERAEENGRQHIFLYTPANEISRNLLNDFAHVESVLLQGKTRTTAGLPRFQIHPNGVEIADLRHEERAKTKYRFWVYKLYGGSERWIQKSSKVTGTEKVVRYKLEYRREVFVIKWHSFGLLELRIPTGNSRAQIAEYRDGLLRDITRILSEGSSDGENGVDALTRVIGAAHRAKLVDESDQIAAPGVNPLILPLSQLDSDARSPDVKWINVSDSLLNAYGVSCRIHADDEHENAYDHPEVRKLFKDVKDCREVRGIIHLGNDAENAQKVSAEFGTGFKNEVRIGAQTTPEAVEFIIRRVWERAFAESLPPSPVDEMARTTDEGANAMLGEIDALSQRYPYLVNAFKGLRQWLSDHPSAGFIDPERLRRTTTAGVPADDFAVALATLVEEGVLVRKFRVRPGPRRQFIPEVFDSFERILSADIKDSKGDSVDLDEARIVPVFGGRAT